MTTRTGGLGRSRSVRYPFLAISWFPGLVLLLIGSLAAGVPAYQGLQIHGYEERFADVAVRASAFTTAVFAERRVSQAHLVAPGGNDARLAAARARVDATLGPFLSAVRVLASDRPDAGGDFGRYLAGLPSGLQSVRERVTARRAGLIEISEAYSEITANVADDLFGAAAGRPVAQAAAEQTISVTLLRATDDLLDADALASAALRKPGGPADAELALLAGRLGGFRSRLAEVEPLLPSAERRDLVALTGSAAWRQLTSAHALALRWRQGIRPTPPMDAAIWDQQTRKVADGLAAITSAHSAHTSGLAAAQGDRLLRRSRVVGGSILVLAAGVFLVTTLVSNRVVKRLRRLRSDTLALAQERLPGIVERLRDGRPVDVEAELPALRYGDDEIGQVAAAFDQAQRTAVTAAAREAETRAGLRTVFLDIARRSQAIVHRQLTVLDQAERNQEDPDQLALLFQLDHLATRARRNAENLIILGGGQAGRQWRNQVPLLEIARSAISEAEDYVRVAIAGLPRVTVTGAAVADVVHLLAELVDNATSFSPPTSRVEVRGNLVGRGAVIEIEDQGLGIDPEQLDQLNRMLREPPDFQVMALAEEPRLGLFVVARLASRHGIRVTLTPSPAYGGTRAVVLLPTEIIDVGPELDVPLPDHDRRPVSMAPPSLDAVLTAPDLFVTRPAIPVGHGSVLSDGEPEVPAGGAEPNSGSATDPGEISLVGPVTVSEAELTRSRMSAFQRGTRRGRADGSQA